MAFWRRSKGRHALGAAATSMPALPVPPLEPMRRFGGSEPVTPVVERLPDVPSVPAPPYTPVPFEWSFPELHPAADVAPVPPPAQPATSGPRVELTFRDGTSASLDDTQARALDELARVLTRRDEVKH